MGKVNIEHDHIRGQACQHVQGDLSILGTFDLHICVFKQLRKNLAELAVIFNDQRRPVGHLPAFLSFFPRREM